MSETAGHCHGSTSNPTESSNSKTVLTFLGLGLAGLFILLVSMVDALHFTGWKWVVFSVSTPIVFIAGKGFHIGAYKSLKTFDANMNTLVSLGTISAWIWSVTALWRDTALYFETAAIIVLIILFGNWLEQRTASGTRLALTKLRQMVPKTVLLENGENIEIDNLTEGMRFKAREGEFVAADGVVLKGEAALDASMITGEPMNQQVTVGDKVIGSTIVTKGSLIITATHTGEATLHSHILQLVEQAQMSVAPVQKLVDKVSGIFSYAVLFIASLAISVWLLTGSAVVTGAEASISVLLIACPCALGLATPIAIMAGTSRGAELGIIIKNSNILETTKNIDTVALDKTGTLTSGKIVIDKVLLAPDARVADADELLDIAVALESSSTHPIGIAIAETQTARRNGAHSDTQAGAYGETQNGAHSDTQNGAHSDTQNGTRTGGLPEIYDFETHHGLGITATADLSGHNIAGLDIAGLDIAEPKKEVVGENGAISEAGKMDNHSLQGDNLQRDNLQRDNLQKDGGVGVAQKDSVGEIQTAELRKVAIGRSELFQEVAPTLLEAQKDAAQNGCITAFCGIEGTAEGLIILKDSLRPEAGAVIQELKGLGIKTVMITGDSKATAELLASQLQMDEVYGEVLPHQKAHIIQQLQLQPELQAKLQPQQLQPQSQPELQPQDVSPAIKVGKSFNGNPNGNPSGSPSSKSNGSFNPDFSENSNPNGNSRNNSNGNLNSNDNLKTKEGNSRVLMVGDGTNDAAALATADLAIAIGSSTEIALESADMGLVGKDLWGVVDALALARKTRRIIASNLFWAFFYNAAAIPLAALGLLSPLIATGAMSFSSLFVILNSTRLRHFKRTAQTSGS